MCRRARRMKFGESQKLHFADFCHRFRLSGVVDHGACTPLGDSWADVTEAQMWLNALGRAQPRC